MRNRKKAKGNMVRGDRMSASILGHKSSGAKPWFILLFVLIVFFGGCVVYEPVPAPAYHGSTFNRAWDSALGAAEDAGVKIISADRNTGLIRGVTSSAEVTISVTTQADGNIRVAFSNKGESDLNDRLAGFYNRRMGQSQR
jgi:hypothetical protein